MGLLGAARAIRRIAGWKRRRSLALARIGVPKQPSSTAVVVCRQAPLPCNAPGLDVHSAAILGAEGWAVGMGRHERRPLRPHKREATSEMHPCETECEKTPAELSNHRVHQGGNPIIRRLRLGCCSGLVAAIPRTTRAPSTGEI